MASNVEQIAELAPEYVWGFPGTPVRIHFRLAVVSRLREHLLQQSSCSGETSRESGGLLLGESRPGHVEITGFYLFEADRQDRHFILSETGKAGMRRAVQARGASVVGYFRTDLRGELRLSKEDMGLIHELFRSPNHVFLVMRLEDDATPVAGFFFWDGGSIFSEATFMQFPLDERLLEPPSPNRHPEPGTKVKPEPKPDPEPDPVKVADRPVIVSTPVLAKRKSRVLWPLVSILMIGVLAGYAAYLRFQSLPPQQAEALPASDSSLMSLSASRTEKDLAIVWNSRLPTVAGARIGILTIRDGEAYTELPLTQAQLQINKLIYVPKSDRLEIMLEVFAADGKPARESVMVVFAAPGTSKPKPIARGDTKLPAPVAAPSTVRTFTVSPLPSSMDPPRRIPEHAVLTEAPTQIAISNPANSKAPDFLLPPVSVPPAAPKATEPAARIAPIQPAKAIRQVTPVLPSNVAAMLKRRVEVQVRVFVDENGRVTKADSLVTSGGISRYLGTIAANAARMWTFHPARQGGTPISSDVVIQLTFGPAN